MITGTISASREAVIHLTLFDSNNLPHELEAVIDTGFNGYLTLPTSLIRELLLPQIGVARLILADGREVTTNDFEVSLMWDGKRVTVSVSQADCDPLVGMSMMYGFELLMPVLDGATFTLRRIAGA